MTRNEWREQVGAYALGALDEAERTAFEAFAQDDEDRELLRRAQAAVGMLERSLPHPRPALWERITAALPPSSLAEAKLRRRKREMIAWSLAIAATLVGLWLWNHDRLLDEAMDRAEVAAKQAQDATRLANDERDAARHEHEASLGAIKACEASLGLLRTDENKALVSALENRNTAIMGFTPAGAGIGQSARWVLAADGQAWVLGEGFSAQPGKSYQLWTIRGKAAPQPAGVATVSESGQLLMRVTDSGSGPPDAMAVSIESDATDDKPEQVLLTARRS